MSNDKEVNRVFGDFIINDSMPYNDGHIVIRISDVQMLLGTQSSITLLFLF